MKVEIKEQPQQVERKYPYVGKLCEIIVLFVSRKEGIVLRHPSLKEGSFSSSWNEEAFTPLPPNSVTITI